MDELNSIEKYNARLVYEAYMSSDDRSQYNANIKELSKKLNLDEKYLKQLRYVYIDSYASDADVKLYDEKKLN